MVANPDDSFLLLPPKDQQARLDPKASVVLFRLSD